MLVPVRAEVLLVNNDWKRTWLLVRMKGLGSQLASFLFKLVHGLLPSQDRVATVGLAVLGTCQQCSLEVEDLEHCFFRCPKNVMSGLTLLGWV